MSEWTRESLLKLLEELRDDMVTPMNPFKRADWIANRAYQLTAILRKAGSEK